jgi:2,3-bisphosphoglycerate-dependent phosphoglycerate mutase
VRERYGDEQYRRRRRSYDAAPPPVPIAGRFDVSDDPRYEGICVPRTESLADVISRLLPYWQSAVVPDLRPLGTILVVAHGNSLRALAAHLDRLSPEEVLELNIPTGMPLLYELDETLVPVVRGGRYLEPSAAAASRAVARLGQACASADSAHDGADPFRRLDCGSDHRE